MVAVTTMAATTRGLCPAGAADVSTGGTTGEEQVPRLSRGQIVAVTLSVGLGVLVAGYGVVSSYVCCSFGTGDSA
jgi:hypothetical protein